MLAVHRVDPSGTAARLGIRAGDAVISINGREIDDVIDYKFHISDERPVIVVAAPGGKERALAVRKDPDDDLGLAFPPLRIRRCRNRCIFCFVDQMPKGCRQSLSVKDDDYRASFLYGNYITLGNLSEKDWDRIAAQRLSPLYVSVHATDPALRRFILGNRNAPDIMSGMKRLAAQGIRMHAQIVLCPGVNDGDRLEKTVRDLAGLFPLVVSIAVVPVGLTKHRKGLYTLRPYTRPAARRVLDTVERMGGGFRKKLGTRLVYPSDEFYIKAGKPVPAPSFYEDFPQIENGVGMVAAFLEEARRVQLPREIRPLTLSLTTGASFSGILKNVLKRFSRVKGLSLNVITVRNRFFGPSVTVSGLLAGVDILHALSGKRTGDMLLVPANALKEDEHLFLDGMSRSALERESGVSVRPVESFGDIAAILNECREARR